MAKNRRKGAFTVKGERLIQAIKKRNRKLPKSRRVNPFAVATARGFRRKR